MKQDNTSTLDEGFDDSYHPEDDELYIDTYDSARWAPFNNPFPT